ncbi:MAG: AAA family ATPase [Candidatus Cloacimonadales bacterium]|jgi:MoxR-like ATPase|nr:AAA family ATPase [Candidatus Cloacimonadota bacterium]MDD2649758.1 AAA family ATPase [Candidatus Cloacimonadota bacterium]MDD3502327.1 AAA family ATPase [Candidatus Cloacimonadota bacterium]MDX9977592.1 AAA family ATPase [Candidatus Cloacimonadales bacterium]
MISIEDIHRQVLEYSQKTDSLINEIRRNIVGQDYMISRMLIGLLADGHILLEGVPGLAKTLAISSMASTLNASFRRIQFTPDLLPADILGTLIYNQKTADFETRFGPIYANFILADEINRAPAKVQSALLESMQERQMTIGDVTKKMPEPFIVMATQNPIEQEGTYPLPEAQVDRFMLKLQITYPSRNEEKEILNRMVSSKALELNQILDPKDILSMRELVKEIHIEENVKDYIINLVFATREPNKIKGLAEIENYIDCGASPRATLFLARAAKAHAFLEHRAYVTPDDIKAIGRDVLRHRIIITYEAEAEQISADDIINKLFDEIEVP